MTSQDARGADHARASQIPSGGGTSSPTLDGSSLKLALGVQAPGAPFSGREQHLVARFPSAKPAQRAMLARIADLYAEGKTVAEAAAELGRKAKFVYHICRAHGLRPTSESTKRAREAGTVRANAPHTVRAEADAKRLREFFAINNVSLFAAAGALCMPHDRVKMIARRYGIKGGSPTPRGLGSPKVEMPAPRTPAPSPSEWIPVAWRRNDRRDTWRECDNAPLGLDQARALCGLKEGIPARPGYFAAHQVSGNKTFLVVKAPRA